VIFLLGPPGVGKSTLGRLACSKLGLRFADFAEHQPPDAADSPTRLKRLVAMATEHAADVIEVPWELQDRRMLGAARKVAILVVLWAHPEDMQARSGLSAPLFTPVPRLKIRGGFGRNGTGCREFRQIDRGSHETMLLVDFSLDEALEGVTECIAEIRQEQLASPAQRERVEGWVEDWRADHMTSPAVTRVMVDAMARYLAHLRSEGTSPRTLSAIRLDLNAAGHLVLMYDSPTARNVLRNFSSPPWDFEFKRKFTDNPTLVARYRRSLEGFAGFLKASVDSPRKRRS